MNKFCNSKKKSFIQSIPTASIESPEDTLSARCKFNFSYYCVLEAGQSFDEWSEVQARCFFEKLTHFSRSPLRHWKNQPVGKSGTVLAIYGAFPITSDFKHPAHVPHEVQCMSFHTTHLTS